MINLIRITTLLTGKVLNEVFLSQLIKDELTKDVLMCEVNGEQVPIDYIPIQHGEYFSRMNVSCYPVQTQASKRGDNIELRDSDTIHQRSNQGRQTPNSPAPNGYNNQAKSSLDIIPKIMSVLIWTLKNLR